MGRGLWSSLLEEEREDDLEFKLDFFSLQKKANEKWSNDCI